MFLKKRHLCNWFLFPAFLSVGEQDWGWSLGSGKTAAKGVPSIGRAMALPSTVQGGQGKDGERSPSPDSAQHGSIRQKHGNRVSLGFTEKVQQASEGSKAQDRLQAHQWNGSGQKQDSRACLKQSYLQQDSQGENHKCNKTDATFNNTGHCSKWVGAWTSNGITSNLLPSAFIIQFSVSERYKTER